MVGRACITTAFLLIDHDFPETYSEFKRALHTVFPFYIDTKHLAEECTHVSSVLFVIGFFLEAFVVRSHVLSSGKPRKFLQR